MGDLSMALQRNLLWILGVTFAIAAAAIYTTAAI